MSHRWTPIVACLNIVLLMAVAGCNRGGDGNAPAAAIPGGASSTTGGNSQRPAADTQHPEVKIETSLGTIAVKLDRVNSPVTVNNFLDYVNSGHYNQTIIHQIYKGQGFLAGGYDKNLVERRPHTPILNEARNGLKNRRGTISMARQPDVIDSSTCQFFINVNVVDNPELDHRDETPEGYGYCVFGEVTAGMDVVDKIGDAPVHDMPDFERTPVQQIIVTSIRQVR